MSEKPAVGIAAPPEPVKKWEGRPSGMTRKQYDAAHREVVRWEDDGTTAHELVVTLWEIFRSHRE